MYSNIIVLPLNAMFFLWILLLLLFILGNQNHMKTPKNNHFNSFLMKNNLKITFQKAKQHRRLTGKHLSI
jgi:hypothetical protein